MNKRRSWWIIFGGDPSDDKESYKRYVSGTGPMNTHLDEECIPVIEKREGDIVLGKEEVLALKKVIETLGDTGKIKPHSRTHENPFGDPELHPVVEEALSLLKKGDE